MPNFSKIIFITNIPSPYRITLFDRLAELIGDKLIVLYYGNKVENLDWNKPTLKHTYIDIKKRNFLGFKIYKGIIKNLLIQKPDIIVTGGFKLPILISIFYIKLFHKKHFINTDAWEHTEKGYSFFHKLIRKIVYKYADAFLPVGEKGALNFMKYGVGSQRIFKVPYCIDSSMYQPTSKTKEYDLMFCGQFIDRKMPFFFCEVAKILNVKYKNLNVLLIGKGSLEKEIKCFLEKEKINYSMPGFIQNNEIAKYYQKSKIFLFPTKSDGWGVVANEACAVGTPVITCENAGTAGDLIIHDYNGYVLPLSADVWAEHVIKLLSNEELYERFSKNAISHVANYSIDKSAEGVAEAIRFVLDKE